MIGPFLIVVGWFLCWSIYSVAEWTTPPIQDQRQPARVAARIFELSPVLACVALMSVSAFFVGLSALAIGLITVAGDFSRRTSGANTGERDVATYRESAANDTSPEQAIHRRVRRDR